MTRLTNSAADQAKAYTRRGDRGPVSLYVHVPFCVRKCAYCDFHSGAISAQEPGLLAHFGWAVSEALAHWSELGFLEDVLSVYIGGGTPTALGDGLVDLVTAVLGTCKSRGDVEVTVETNPETTDSALIARLVDAGVNRFSVGVQSLDDAVLGMLGRCHDAAAAEHAVRACMAAGARVSLDLMCGVPGQSHASWLATVKRAVGFGVGHVSVYPLTVEDDTLLARRIRAGHMVSPEPDAAAEMMELAHSQLAAHGLERYEVASYARPGQRCIRNVGYWSGRPYIGIGPSSSSMLPVEMFLAAAACRSWTDPLVAGVGRVVDAVPHDTARVRFTRAADTVAFVRFPAGAPEEIEYLSAREAAREDAMLGLRLAEGIGCSLAEEAGVTAVLARMVGTGLVAAVDDGERRYRLTDAGWLLGNEVFAGVWNADS